METEILSKGVELTLVGMGTVLVFLTILIGATTLMSRIVMRLSPDVADSGADEEEVAAISAAISRHRRER